MKRSPEKVIAFLFFTRLGASPYPFHVEFVKCYFLLRKRKCVVYRNYIQDEFSNFAADLVRRGSVKRVTSCCTASRKNRFTI